MGLNTTYGAYDGPYHSFHFWRRYLASLLGIDFDMFDTTYPKSFDKNEYPGFVEFLNHSDCDGEISYEELCKLTPTLQKLLPKINNENMKELTEKFIEGCQEAMENKDGIEFR